MNNDGLAGVVWKHEFGQTGQAMLQITGPRPPWSADRLLSLRTDRAHESVNDFVADGLWTLTCRCRGFRVCARIRAADLLNAHLWVWIRQFDPVLDELTLQRLNIHKPRKTPVVCFWRE